MMAEGKGQMAENHRFICVLLSPLIAVVQLTAHTSAGILRPP